MNETETAEWLKLLQGGGNAAIIVLSIIAVRVATAFLAALREIVTTQNSNHAEVIASQEEIKRAIVALDPQTAKEFARRSG